MKVSSFGLSLLLVLLSVGSGSQLVHGRSLSPVEQKVLSVFPKKLLAFQAVAVATIELTELRAEQITEIEERTANLVKLGEIARERAKDGEVWKLDRAWGNAAEIETVLNMLMIARAESSLEFDKATEAEVETIFTRFKQAATDYALLLERVLQGDTSLEGYQQESDVIDREFEMLPPITIRRVRG